MRVGLLVTVWIYRKIGNSLIHGAQTDHSKFVTYYHTHHVNHSQPLLVCQPIQIVGNPQFLICNSYTKEDIDELDTGGTLQYIWKYEREEFLPEIIMLPLISIIGIFGTSFFNFISFHSFQNI